MHHVETLASQLIDLNVTGPGERRTYSSLGILDNPATPLSAGSIFNSAEVI